MYGLWFLKELPNIDVPTADLFDFGLSVLLRELDSLISRNHRNMH